MSGLGSSSWAVGPAPPAAGLAVSGNAGLGPRRWLIEHGPWLLTALGALAYLMLKPPSGDLAAQLYRADLFARHGFVLWDGQWYGGHHMLDYSVLLPPLGALLGVRMVGALTAVASAVLFAGIVRRHFDGVATAGGGAAAGCGAAAVPSGGAGAVPSATQARR